MSENHLQNKVASGLFWTFAERICAQVVSFVVSLILARLLLPSEYGAVSMTMVFISLANVLVSNGLGESLVQKKDSDELDFSTILICAMALSVVLYAIVFLCAPLVSTFYNLNITTLLRVLALKIPLTAINSIQQAYVAKKMIFKKMFWATSIGTALSGIIGIAMAWSGMGAWALVAQYLVNSCVDTVVLWIVLPWKPKVEFNGKRAKELVPYGWKIMISSLINTAFNEIRSLFIGKIYTSADLAFYQKGNQFPGLVINNIDTAIGKVIFPAMSSVNDRIDRLKQMARKSIRLTSFIIFPIMLGMLTTADKIIVLLLTEKWNGAIIFLRLACLFYALQPLQTADWQIIKAAGRADLCVKLEAVKKIMGIILLVISAFISVEAVGISSVITAAISTIINMIPAGKLANYSLKEHFGDIWKTLSASILMCILIYVLGGMISNTLVCLIVQVLVGACLYIAFSFMLKNEALISIIEILKAFMSNRMRGRR